MVHFFQMTFYVLELTVNPNKNVLEDRQLAPHSSLQEKTDVIWKGNSKCIPQECCKPPLATGHMHNSQWSCHSSASQDAPLFSCHSYWKLKATYSWGLRKGTVMLLLCFPTQSAGCRNEKKKTILSLGVLIRGREITVKMVNEIMWLKPTPFL